MTTTSPFAVTLTTPEGAKYHANIDLLGPVKDSKRYRRFAIQPQWLDEPVEFMGQGLRDACIHAVELLYAASLTKAKVEMRRAAEELDI